jgi:large subunit ribosomal protein L21
MYAVMKSGGKQYRVKVGDKLKLEKLEAEVGSTIEFNEIYMISDDGKNQIAVNNAPLAGAAVKAQVLSQGRGKKITIIKMKRRKHHMKTQGHRQSFTEVEILGIQAA